MKPRTTYDPKTSQYCCPVILDTDEPSGAPWHVAYCDVDLNYSGTGMSIYVNEIVAADGAGVDLAAVDVEWIEDQCRDAISDARRDDNLIYKIRSSAITDKARHERAHSAPRSNLTHADDDQ